jgi:hypothetical protein
MFGHATVASLACSVRGRLVGLGTGSKVAVEMISHSQALLLGCVGLQLEELIFKFESRSVVSEPFGAPGASGCSAKHSCPL